MGEKGSVVGIIGGTGVGEALVERMDGVEMREVDTPFGRAAGAIAVGRIGGRDVAFLNRHGKGHRLNPSKVPYRANVFALKSLGVGVVIGTGAVGSLREEMSPGELVLVDQFIDKTYRRAGSFFDELGAVHCEFSHPCCGRLREVLGGCLEDAAFKVHTKGTYVCMEGPAFSSRAESLLHRQWGGDLIGMTAMPEAKLAREAQMCYGLVALVSDYDCWREHHGAVGPELIKEIIGNLNEATSNALNLIEGALGSGFELADSVCGCRKSLEMAVWTDDEFIDNAERERLGVLFE